MDILQLGLKQTIKLWAPLSFWYIQNSVKEDKGAILKLQKTTILVFELWCYIYGNEPFGIISNLILMMIFIILPQCLSKNWSVPCFGINPLFFQQDRDTLSFWWNFSRRSYRVVKRTNHIKRLRLTTHLMRVMIKNKKRKRSKNRMMNQSMTSSPGRKK